MTLLGKPFTPDALLNSAEAYRVSRRPHFLGGWGLWDVRVGFSPEVRERTVLMVEEHREAHASEWAVLQSVAPKLGCTAETLRQWVRQAHVTRAIGRG